MKRLKVLAVLLLFLCIIPQLNAAFTMVWCTGFEYGLAAPVISGTDFRAMWAGVTGSPAISTAVKRTGSYALLCSATAAAEVLQRNTTGNPTYVVARFYVQYSELPITRTMLFAVNSGTEWAFGFSALGNFCVDFAGSSIVQGPTPTTGVWYRVDLRFHLDGVNKTIDWAIDGAAQTQGTATSSQTAIASYHIGWSQSAGTGSVYYDDMAISYTSADYPIGAGNVIALRPVSDGSHTNTTDQMEDSAGNDIDGATYFAWDKLDDDPFTTEAAADYVRQATGSATDYFCVVNFADTTHTTINGVSASLHYASATATANNGACEVWDSNNQITTVWGISTTLADYSESTAFDKSVIVAVPSGGWTMAYVNALVSKFGYSTDSDPDPYWLALILEVDYGADAPPSGYIPKVIIH